MTRINIGIVAALALAVALGAVSAQAAGNLTRTFVSSAGIDTNPCTIAQPCATFAAAYNAVAADGIVAALDPGKYGPLTINGPVTINGNGWAAITGTAQGAGITINADTSNGDVVILTGLEIDGAGAAYNGIVFNSAGSLTITNCIVQNFFGSVTSGNGILLQPSSGPIVFAITNSTFSNNIYSGIVYSPQSGSATATGVIDHVVATNNEYGIGVLTSLGGGSTKVAISNSIFSNNTGDGISFISGSGSVQGSIDNSSISGNGVDGIDAETSSDLEIGRSVITYNGTGVLNNTSPNRVYSYQDNRINSNSQDIGGSNGATLTQSHALQ